MKQSYLVRRLAPLGTLRVIAAALSFALAACVTQPPASVAAAPVAAAQSVPARAATGSASGFSADLAEPEDREEAFDHAWHLVNDRFYDPAFNGLDWEAARLRYLPQLERVQSDAAFYSLLGKMVGELKDSHTRVYTAREYRNRMESVMSTVGIRVAEVDGEVAVVEVMPDTPASQAGMRPGMVVESINGEPARDKLHKLIADAPKDASPERRLRNIYGRMLSSQGALALEVRAGDARRRFELARTEREMPLVVTNQLLAGNVGLIRFNRFRSDVSGDFARALSRLADTDGIVLDLRGNPGGNIGAMLSIAQSFFPEARHVLTRRTRPAAEVSDEGWRVRIPPEVRITANGRAYTRPIAILIDGYSASASELLATILREQRGAYIVGRPSCGCVVGVRGSGYRLAGGGALYVAETGFVTPRGNQMEGAGIRPDREVPFTLADLGAGIDRDLVIAREWIIRQSHRQAEEH